MSVQHFVQNMRAGRGRRRRRRRVEGAVNKVQAPWSWRRGYFLVHSAIRLSVADQELTSSARSMPIFLVSSLPRHALSYSPISLSAVQ